MGFLRGPLDVKLLVLYIMSRVAAPISFDALTDLVLDCEEVDYFLFAQEVGELERLLICAPAFDVGLNQRYENITVRKIPQSVLDKCEYGVDNYNLNIVNPPELDEEEWEDA